MAAVEELITEHIDVWTSAVKRKSSAGRGGGKKIELYGVKKLRELILDLAVRGLLVPQDANDMPATELLKKGATEKLEFIEKGTIKKQKKLPPIKPSQVAYDLPFGWSLAKLPDVSFFQEGPGILAKDFTGTGVPLIRISGMHSTMVSLEGCNFLDEEMVKKKWDHFRLDLGDTILSSSASLGKVSKVGNEAVGAIVYTGLIRFKPFVSLFEGYLIKFFESGEFVRQINESKTGAAIKHFGPTHLKTMLIPIPPLPEQHRIVAKVDELMALCDQLEQQSEANLAAHQTLVQTLLDALTQAASQPNASSPTAAQPTTNASTPFEQAWHRIAQHFDTLFTTEHSIELLKQSILQLAVMGKLVPQDPNDEPASELLKRIAAEKAELAKAKKIKKQKVLPEIGEDEKPFDLPVGWEWKNLNDVFALVTDGDHQAPPKSDSGIPFLVIGNLNTGIVNLLNCRFVPKSYYEKLDWGRRPQSNDLLYTVTGSYGIPVEVKTDENFCVQRHVAIFKAVESTPVQYISHLLRSRFSFEYATEIATGIAQKTVPLTGLRKMPIAVPPEAEQHRIVAKVDELLALCDQLKARLTDAQSTQLQLADAVTEQAIA